MTKLTKKEFEKGLLKLGYVRQPVSKEFPLEQSFERYFGRYTIHISLYDKIPHTKWSLQGWCELTPKVETEVGFERDGKLYDIDAVKKAEIAFARLVKNKFIPFLQPACIMSKELEALLKK